MATETIFTHPQQFTVPAAKPRKPVIAYGGFVDGVKVVTVDGVDVGQIARETGEEYIGASRSRRTFVTGYELTLWGDEAGVGALDHVFPILADAKATVAAYYTRAT